MALSLRGHHYPFGGICQSRREGWGGEQHFWQPHRGARASLRLRLVSHVTLLVETSKSEALQVRENKKWTSPGFLTCGWPRKISGPQIDLGLLVPPKVCRGHLKTSLEFLSCLSPAFKASNYFISSIFSITNYIMHCYFRYVQMKREKCYQL